MNLRLSSDNGSKAAPGVRRQPAFPAIIVRAGGQVTKATYHVKCSRCSRTAQNDASKIRSDSLVSEKFQKRGWILGKTRAADVCPSCASGDPTKPADNQIINNPGEVVLSLGQLAEQLFMPDRKGDTGRVVVEQRGRPMSRARQQAEVVASSIFAQPAERPILGLGGARSPAPPNAATEGANPAPQHKTATSVEGQRDSGFERRVEAVVEKLANGMSALTGSMEVLVEQMNKMATLQASLLNVTTATKDQSAEQAKLAKLNNEAIARLAPMVSNTTDVILGNVREAVSDMRQLAQTVAKTKVETTPGEEPAVVARQERDDVTAHAAPSLPDVVGRAASEGAATPQKSRSRRTKAEIATARAVDERLVALGLKRGRGRPSKDALTDVELAEVLASTSPEATLAEIRSRREEAAAAETAKAAGEPAAPLVARKGDRKATTAETVASEVQAAPERGSDQPSTDQPAAELFALGEESTSVSADESAVLTRRRRTKAEIEAAAALEAKLASLGLKRGRGRPARDALTAEELAEIGASSRPKATLKAILDRRAKAQYAAVAVPVESAAVPVAKVPTPSEDKPKHGCPKKNAEAASVSSERSAPEATQAVLAPAEPVAEKPKRGRPKKSVEAVAQPDIVPAAPVVDKPKRGRPKNAESAPASLAKSVSQVAQIPVAAASASVEEPAKKKRGRPRKDATPAIQVKEAARPKTTKVERSKPLSDVDWSRVSQSHDVMVLTMEGITTFQIDRSVWNEAGFAAEDKIGVEINGEEFRLSKSETGVKPATISSAFVVVSFSGLEVPSLWKIQHVTKDGILLLKGAKAL